MHKFCWQRWTLMFLLVTRLVIGELGHAMPMMSMGAHEQAMSVAQSDFAACSEHERGDEMPSAHHAGSSADHTNQASGEHDCCKSGECECPCLHVPCAALDALILNSIATDSLRTSYGNDGVVSQRPSGLFRPPA